MGWQWDLFCRVVDNHGDIGVCWRLAADLASRGHRVRLFVDDASALTWMAPQGAARVTVHAWPAEDEALPDGLGEVVIEAFGCDPPARFVERMAAAPQPPVWINLEYLSAEPVVARNHGLPSPQLSGPGRGLTKWFYYPGFTPNTGGLLREAGLAERRRRFDPVAWLEARRIPWSAHERRVTLFCYDNPALPALLGLLADAPTRLLVPPGPAAAAVQAVLGDRLHRGRLAATLLPHLSQTDFDHLLWASDVNVVRGEDSFVRAQFAGRPIVWHIYPQADGAHVAKLEAWLDLMLATAAPELAQGVRRLHRGWNGIAPLPPVLPSPGPWEDEASRWGETLLGAPDLVSRLLDFVQPHDLARKR